MEVARVRNPRPKSRGPNRRSLWPWVVVGWFVVAGPLGLGLVVVNGSPLLEQLGFVIAFGLFALVGAMICSREPRNRIGVLLLYAASTTVTFFAAAELATYLVDRGHGDEGLTQAVAIAGGSGWGIGIVPALFLLSLLFPDGRLPSHRWRPVLWLSLALPVVITALMTFGIPEVAGSQEDAVVRNPLYLPSLDAAFLDQAAGFILVAMLGLCASALVVRFRRSTGVERQQIKWMAAAGLAFFASAGVSQTIYALGYETPLLDAAISGLGFTAIPTAIGVSVLRYKLYELDVVIRKTLVAAVLTVTLVLVYAAVVAGGTALLGRSDPTLGAIAAVVLALGFQPARTWTRRAVDHVVYGKRATPYEVLAEFSERVADTLSDDDVLDQMASAVARGTDAERVDVWLRIEDGLRIAASYPPSESVAPPVSVTDGVPATLGESNAVYPIEHERTVLGALAVVMPPADPMTPAKDRLISGLAAQAGLVLRNVRLTEELRARLDELRAAQKRLVSAQDAERRRLERNIHDGAQQQLVALTVRLRLAQSLASRDPDALDAMLTELQSETQAALEDLRDLARGIYPPLLADRGLVTALEAQAKKSVVPIKVTAVGIGRYPPEIEAAVYFSVLEAIQNSSKYAEASSVRVAFLETDGTLTFAVEDDGRGFDPAHTGYGTGLQGIADRIAALDGTLEISSSPGSGATVRGHVPVGTRHEAPRKEAVDEVSA